MRDLKLTMGSLNPKLMMVFVMMTGVQENYHELPEFIDLAHSLSIEQVTAKNLDVITKDGDFERGLFSHDGHWLTDVETIREQAKIRAEELGIDLRLYNLKPQQQVICEQYPTHNLYINWAGNLSPCITLSYAENRYFNGEKVHVPCQIFGNINEETVEEIWEKKEYKAFRSIYHERLNQQRAHLMQTVLGSDNELSMLPAPEGCQTCYYLMASETEILREWLSKADFRAVDEFAGRNRRILSFLTALTYDPDPLIIWRAIEAMGRVAASLADVDSELIRTHLRRLVWLLNDESGGIGWRAPEAIGEIISQRPETFSEFIPILVNLLNMEPEDAVRFRAGWLWAIGRLSHVRPDDTRSALPWILPCLQDSDPILRGLAVLCLKQMAIPIPTGILPDLTIDEGKVDLYVSPYIETVKICDLLDRTLSISGSH